ncbi:unnamed protein product [Adineta steineri]|uniref:Uncharacterized protein n=1 Tax=Adineta steineri TaxID=433720 RepID=A0A819HK91_9BILA|nr:unnamed protein product [Adineta steineri]CAF3898646.1 unnamed protein product [Adineta steineri]
MLGFNSKNLEDIHQQYICKICSLILRNPVQLTCGHRLCKSCVEFRLQGDKIKCPECQEEMQRDEILPDKGVANDMKSLEIECSLCAWKGIFKDYENHLQTDHLHPSCEYCGKAFDSINDLDLHKLNTCDKITLSCALKDYGCSTSVLRIEMSEHYRSEQHQNAIIAFVRRDLPRLTGAHHDRGSHMEIDNIPHTTTSISTYNNTQLEEIYETTDILSNGLKTMDDDAQRLTNESVEIQKSIEDLNKNIGTLKLSVQEQNTYLDGVKPNLDIIQQDVLSLKQTVEDFKSISYDGTFTWKIPNFSERMADAQTERQTSIYSPPFYSSPTGYKMRARLYLFGDGNARRTHMSLFFVLMRSEYDGILKFPFNYKVTFCLFDQSPAQRHIIDSFRPDTKSNSFQRPRSEMNIASGIPKFCSLSVIQQEGNPYVRDDTIFIKIMVDFGDIPKLLLPFAFNINPGLPTNVHQRLIKQELERRAQQTPTSTTSPTATGLLPENNE